MDFLVRSLNWVGSQMWGIANIFRGVADNPIIDSFGLSGGFNWLADNAENAAYGLWDAAEGAYDAGVWMGDRARELWDLASYTYNELAQNFWYLWNQVQDLARQSWDWLTNQVNWLLSQVSQLWDRFWGWAEPLLNAAWAWLGQLASYVTDTLWPWVQGQVTNLWDWFTQRYTDLLGWVDENRRNIGELAARLNPWDSLVGQIDRIRWFVTDAWDTLTRLVADPPGTIWAWLEVGLWARVEAWLITVWDGTDRKV